jgi:hypothetical protein
MNIVLLFTLFQKTKSLTYSIVIACFDTLLAMIDFLPRISKKHEVFYFVGFAESLVLVSLLICQKLLIDK